MILKIFKNSRAFTLIEVITVLFVISVGLLGVLSLIVQNIQTQGFNKKNVIAYQLAQEGIELIRKVRDSNWRARANGQTGINWDTGLDHDPMADDPENYYMDYRDSVPTFTTGADPVKLYIDNNGFYIHDSSNSYPESGFSRLVRIEKINDDEMSVLSRVTWGDHNRNFSYVLETILYDWR